MGLTLIFRATATYPLAAEEEKASYVVLFPRFRSLEQLKEDVGKGLGAPLGAVVDDAARGLCESVEDPFAVVKVIGRRLGERVPVGVVVDDLHHVSSVLVPSRQVVVMAVAVRARGALKYQMR